MKHLYYYDGLDQEDVRELKKSLLEWTENNPTGILLFNTTIISKIHYRMSKQSVSGYRFGNGLSIENITITWHQLPGNKGILKSIKRKTDRNREEVLYKEPDSWEEASLWYEFKLE